MKNYQTPKEESERLKSSLRTMRQRIKNREIPFYRFGRKILLVPEEVDAALDRNRVRALDEPKRPAGRIADAATAANG